MSDSECDPYSFRYALLCFLSEGDFMLVFVKNRNGKPLMPCSPTKARKLLKAGQAKVDQRTPFVIKLKFGSSGYTQKTTAGMDTGSKVIGNAATSHQKTLYQSETILRGDEIKSKMEQRRMYRRSRRGRKTRYRKPRFLNRRASTREGRLAPSLLHKVKAHLKERKFIESILPISHWKVELSQFDIHAISNPDVSKRYWWTYQNGPQKNFYNTKSYILSRDEHTCQSCKSKKKNLKLHVHHIEFRSNGGTDAPTNLITLCKNCHDKVHNHNNAQQEFLKMSKKIKNKTKHATETNIIASHLQNSDWSFEETFGFETKFKREKLRLPKEHYFDAVAICLADDEMIKFEPQTFIKRLIAKGDYQQTKGIRSEKKMRTEKILGFKKFDKVEWMGHKAFIKGRMSSGYAILMDIKGDKINLKPIPKLKNGLVRIQARKSSIIDQKIIENTSFSTTSSLSPSTENNFSFIQENM